MKTLEELMAGVTPLPWPIEDACRCNSWFGDTTETRAQRIRNRILSVRAANAFPKLVEFVLEQPCMCLVWNAGQCNRCALLEEVLK